YENVCFVRVITGARMIARMPVEIMDDRVATVRVGLTPETEQHGELQYKLAELLRSYKEAVDVHETGRGEVNSLMTKQRFPEALKRASACRTALDDDMRRLAEQTSQLKREIGDAPISLADCDKYMSYLQGRKRSFNERVVGFLEEVERVANDPNRKE